MNMLSFLELVPIFTSMWINWNKYWNWFWIRITVFYSCRRFTIGLNRTNQIDNKRRISIIDKSEQERFFLGLYCDKYSIRLIKNCESLQIGFSYPCGTVWFPGEWGLHCKLYIKSHSLEFPGIITVTLNQERATLSLVVNGNGCRSKVCGASYDSFRPAFRCLDAGCEFEFCDYQQA